MTDKLSNKSITTQVGGNTDSRLTGWSTPATASRQHDVPIIRASNLYGPVANNPVHLSRVNDRGAIDKAPTVSAEVALFQPDGCYKETDDPVVNREDGWILVDRSPWRVESGPVKPPKTASKRTLRRRAQRKRARKWAEQVRAAQDWLKEKADEVSPFEPESGLHRSAHFVDLDGMESVLWRRPLPFCDDLYSLSEGSAKSIDTALELENFEYNCWLDEPGSFKVIDVRTGVTTGYQVKELYQGGCSHRILGLKNPKDFILFDAITKCDVVEGQGGLTLCVVGKCLDNLGINHPIVHVEGYGLLSKGQCRWLRNVGAVVGATIPGAAERLAERDLTYVNCFTAPGFSQRSGRMDGFVMVDDEPLQQVFGYKSDASDPSLRVDPDEHFLYVSRERYERLSILRGGCHRLLTNIGYSTDSFVFARSMIFTRTGGPSCRFRYVGVSYEEDGVPHPVVHIIQRGRVPADVFQSWVNFDAIIGCAEESTKNEEAEIEVYVKRVHWWTFLLILIVTHFLGVKFESLFAQILVLWAVVGVLYCHFALRRVNHRKVRKHTRWRKRTSAFMVMRSLCWFVSPRLTVAQMIVPGNVAKRDYVGEWLTAVSLASVSVLWNFTKFMTGWIGPNVVSWCVTLRLIDAATVSRRESAWCHVPGLCYLRVTERYLGFYPQLDAVLTYKKPNCPNYLVSWVGSYHIHSRVLAADDVNGINFLSRSYQKSIWNTVGASASPIGFSNFCDLLFPLSILVLLPWWIVCGTYFAVESATVFRLTREKVPGYCYMRAFDKPVDLGAYPSMDNVLRELVRHNQSVDRIVFVTVFGNYCHITYEPLNETSEHLIDFLVTRFDGRLLVGGTGETITGLMTIVWVVETTMRWLVEGMNGYCYVGLTRVPFIWLLGPWPSAYLLTPFIRCDQNYTLTNIPGAFHVEVGGSDGCLNVARAFWKNPLWRVGGFPKTKLWKIVFQSLPQAWMSTLKQEEEPIASFVEEKASFLPEMPTIDAQRLRDVISDIVCDLVRSMRCFNVVKTRDLMWSVLLSCKVVLKTVFLALRMLLRPILRLPWLLLRIVFRVLFLLARVPVKYYVHLALWLGVAYLIVKVCRLMWTEWCSEVSGYVSSMDEVETRVEAATVSRRWWSTSDLFGSLMMLRSSETFELMDIGQTIMRFLLVYCCWEFLPLTTTDSIYLSLATTAFVSQHHGSFCVPTVKFFTCGTTGDILPVERYVVRMMRQGFDVIHVPLIDASYAKEKLSELEKGGGIPAADSLGYALINYLKNWNPLDLCLVPWTLRTGRKTLTYDLSPAPYNRGPFRVVNDTNIVFCLINAVVNIANVATPTFRFGDFYHCCPRLKLSYAHVNNERTGRALISLGNSSIAVEGDVLKQVLSVCEGLEITTDNEELAKRMDWRYEKDPLHDEWFQMFDVICTHGGAGTMQTALASRQGGLRAKVYSLSQALDRQWVDNPVMYRHSENYLISNLVSHCGPVMWARVLYQLAIEKDLEFFRCVSLCLLSVLTNILLPAMILQDLFQGGFVAHLFAMRFWLDIQRCWVLFVASMFVLHNVSSRMNPATAMSFFASLIGMFSWYATRLLEPKRLASSLVVGPVTTILVEAGLDLTDFLCPGFTSLWFFAMSKLGFAYTTKPGVVYVALRAPVIRGCLIPIPWKVSFFDEKEFIYFENGELHRTPASEAEWMRRDFAIPLTMTGLTLDSIWDSYNRYLQLSFWDKSGRVKDELMNWMETAGSATLMVLSIVFAVFVTLMTSLSAIASLLFTGIFGPLYTLTLICICGFVVATAFVLSQIILVTAEARAIVGEKLVDWTEKTEKAAQAALDSLKDSFALVTTVKGYWFDWNPKIAWFDLSFGMRRKVNAGVSRMSAVLAPLDGPYKSVAGYTKRLVNQSKRLKTQWAPLSARLRRPRLYNGRLGFVVAGDPKFHFLSFQEVWDDRMAFMTARSKKPVDLTTLPPLTRRIRRKCTLRNYSHLVGQAAVDGGADGTAFATKSTMIASLREYTYEKKRPLDTTREEEIAQAIFDQEPDKYSHAEMANPWKVARDFCKKRKMNAGLDFCYIGLRRRCDILTGGLFKAMVEFGCRPYETGKFLPTLFHAFPKSQIVDRKKLKANPAKIRSVTASTGADNITQGILCLDLNKRKPSSACMSKAGIPSTGFFLNQLFEALEKCNFIYSLDVRAFDRNINDSLIAISTKIKKLAFAEHPESETIHKWLDCLDQHTRYGYIVNLVNDSIDKVRGEVSAVDQATWDEIPTEVIAEIERIAEEVVHHDDRFPGGYLRKVGGGATGDYNVTFTNTIACQAFVIDSVCTLLDIEPSEFKNHCSFFNVSDDNTLGINAEIDVAALVAIAKERHGLDLKVESSGKTVYDQVFCAKRPVDATEFEAEFKKANIPLPRFAILHDAQRLDTSIAQAKTADERKKNLSSVAYHRWEIERLSGLMYNCTHRRELFNKLHDDAMVILMKKIKQKKHRVGLHIPEYDEMLRNFYSPKRVHDFEKCQKLTISYPPEQFIHDQIYLHAKNLSSFARSTTLGDLGEFPEYRAPHAEITNGFFEPFLWLSFYANYGKEPTVAELANLCERSAFSAFCNADQWLRVHVDEYEAMDEQVRFKNLQHQSWVMLVYSACYYVVNDCVHLLNCNQYTRIVMYLAQIYRFDLPMLFAAGSHIHFLGKGEPSTGLSNLMPKDRHHYIKRITLIVARLVPIPYFLSTLPVNSLLRVVAEAVDRLGYMPTMLTTADVAVSRIEVGSAWEDAATRIAQLFRKQDVQTVVITSPCGAGKTRYLPDALLAPSVDGSLKEWKRVVVVMPRRILCDEYVKRKPGTIWKKKGVKEILVHMTCTYGYLGHLIKDGRPPWFDDTLFVFDEAHERSVDWMYVFKKMEGKIKAVLMTATPLTWMKRYPLVTVDVATPFPVEEEDPVTNSMIDEFIQRHRTHKRILMIHPSESACKRFVASLTSMGFQVTLLSASCSVLPEKGHVVATSVADSSLTLPMCDLVIDSGLSMVNQTGMLETVTYDLATKIQRMGRTGRTCPGTYVSFKKPVTFEYKVCPSLDHVLTKSHYLEYFQIDVELDTVEDEKAVNQYLHFTNEGSPREKSSAEFFTMISIQASMSGKNIFDVYRGACKNDELVTNWLEQRRVMTIDNFDIAKYYFETLRPFYKCGDRAGLALYYKNNKVGLI